MTDLSEKPIRCPFLVVARLDHLGEPPDSVLGHMQGGVRGAEQCTVPAHAFLLGRLMVRHRDVHADRRLNAADVGDEQAHVLRGILVAAT